MRTKRITMMVNPNIDAIKKQMEAEHGVELTYAQVLDMLTHFYRKHKKLETTWRT